MGGASTTWCLDAWRFHWKQVETTRASYSKSMGQLCSIFQNVKSLRLENSSFFGILKVFFILLSSIRMLHILSYNKVGRHDGVIGNPNFSTMPQPAQPVQPQPEVVQAGVHWMRFRWSCNSVSGDNKTILVWYQYHRQKYTSNLNESSLRFQTARPPEWLEVTVSDGNSMISPSLKGQRSLQRLQHPCVQGQLR